MVPASSPHFQLTHSTPCSSMGCQGITESINIKNLSFSVPPKEGSPTALPTQPQDSHLWSFLVRVPISRFITLLAEQANKEHFENYIFPAKLNSSPLGIQFTEKDGGRKKPQTSSLSASPKNCGSTRQIYTPRHTDTAHPSGEENFHMNTAPQAVADVIYRDSSEARRA